MSRFCEMTGRGPTTGNLVSHSNIKTRTLWNINLQKKKYTVIELGQTLTIKVSTHAIKTIDKQGGISRALLLAKDDLLSDKLLHVKKQLVKALRAPTKSTTTPPAEKKVAAPKAAKTTKAAAAKK